MYYHAGMMTLEHFSLYLRSALAAKGWSIQTLAERADVPYESARKYVSGTASQPTLRTISRLVAALGDELVIRSRQDCASPRTLQGPRQRRTQNSSRPA